MSHPAPLSIRGVYAEAWRLTRRHWKVAVLPVLALDLANRGVLKWLDVAFPADQLSVVPLFVLLYVLAFTFTVAFGQAQVLFGLYDHGEAGFADFLRGAKRTVALTVGCVLYLGLSALGLLLFVVPGILLGARLVLGWAAMLDHGQGPIAGLKTSWALTKGKTLMLWALFVPTILFIVVESLGLPFEVMLGIDVLSAVNFSVSTFAGIHLYRQLTHDSSVEAPAAA